jgi:hypothetical protein
MATTVIILGAAAVVAVTAWFVGTRKFPESAAEHDRPGDDSAARQARIQERPAGPDAENMVDGRAAAEHAASTRQPGGRDSGATSPRRPTS